MGLESIVGTATLLALELALWAWARSESKHFESRRLAWIEGEVAEVFNSNDIEEAKNHAITYLRSALPDKQAKLSQVFEPIIHKRIFRRLLLAVPIALLYDIAGPWLTQQALGFKILEIPITSANLVMLFLLALVGDSLRLMFAEAKYILGLNETFPN